MSVAVNKCPCFLHGHLLAFYDALEKYFWRIARLLLNFAQKIVLASASPRRVFLLKTLGIPFVQAPSTTAEPLPTSDDQLHPAQFVERLAQHKADHCPVPANLPRPLIVLGADTIVWHRDQIVGKPRDATHAAQILRGLRGDKHQVFTGVCLKVLLPNEITGNILTEHESTSVYFAPVSDRWINLYVAGGESLDKAGAYAAQGRGAALVQRIEGDYWNVVGLPLARLARMLETLGAPIENWWQDEKAIPVYS